MNFPPGKHLSRYIEQYWCSGSYLPGHDPLSEYYPDGNTDVLIEFSPSRCRFLVFGPAAHKAFIKTRMDCRYFCIRFRPGKFPDHADIEAASLVDRFIEVPKIFDYDADLLGDRLNAARFPEDRIRIIETLPFMQELQHHTRIGNRRYAVECIEKSGGIAEVGEIAQAMGISRRQLERRVTRQVGMPPKRLSRTVRLQRILAMLGNGYRYRLTDLAYQYGYADQSHFVNDIRSLTGRTPGYFLGARPGESHFTLLPTPDMSGKSRVYHQI